MELMLVLTIIVVVGASVLPVLKGPLTNQRLRKAGDAVRAEWNRTRVRAMKTGRIQVFRAQIGSAEYTVQTWYADDDDLASTNDSMKFGGQSDSRQSDSQGLSHQLPDGVLFTAGDASSDSRATKIEHQFGAGQSVWLHPILFYPDGTTSTAKFVLGDERQLYFLVVSLRGLTGIAQTSDLLTAQEVSQ